MNDTNQNDELSATEEFLNLCKKAQCHSDSGKGKSPVSSNDDFKPNVRKSIGRILQAFNYTGDIDFVAKALTAIRNFYSDENDVPQEVLALKDKEPLSAEDCIVLADECLCCIEEELAAVLCAAGYYANGAAMLKGKALVKLAELCLDANCLQHRELKFDTMDLVEIISEAQTLGCEEEASSLLEAMRKRFFGDFMGELDVDYLIDQEYDSHLLCLAAFCLNKGIGWEKDVPSATRLYEAALAQGYPRADYYLKKLRNIKENPE